MKLKRPLFGPDHPSGNGPTRGRDVVLVKRALRRVEQSFFPMPPAGFDDVYNRRTANAVHVFQRLNGIRPRHFDQATLDALWPYFDRYGKWRYARFVWLPPKPEPVLARCFPVAARFPVRNFGGVAAHMSRPLGNWQSDNAIDVGAPERAAVLAIEAGRVVKVSGHDPAGGPVGTIFGQSITIRLDSGVEVFYTHQKMHPQTELGERVVAGEMISWVADYGAAGRWPEHLHIAFSHGNPESLWNTDRYPRVAAFPAD